MPCEHTVGLRAGLRLDERYQLGLDELEKLVGAAARREARVRVAGLVYARRREVARAVCVGDADDNHLGHACVAREEGDRAARVLYVRVAVGHVEDWEAL